MKANKAKEPGKEKIKLTIEEKDKLGEERKRIGEKRAKVEAGFIDRCDNLLMYFDPNGEGILNEFFCTPVETQRDFVFDNYSRTFGKGPFTKEKYKDFDCMNPQMWEEIFQEAEWTPYRIAFAIGFAIGQEIDVTDPEIRADIEAIKKVIQKNQLFPYLPREKRAA